MLSVTIVSLKILTGTFCNCLSYEKALIMERDKELSNSQKALMVKLWKVKLWNALKLSKVTENKENSSPIETTGRCKVYIDKTA